MTRGTVVPPAIISLCSIRNERQQGWWASKGGDLIGRRKRQQVLILPRAKNRRLEQVLLEPTAGIERPGNEKGVCRDWVAAGCQKLN